jgi:hypothetical protein|tara:strand:+ start:1968 stop:2171 length:204 start_codon:yes stop_codon:yes gene_type:complete
MKAEYFFMNLFFRWVITAKSLMWTGLVVYATPHFAVQQVSLNVLDATEAKRLSVSDCIEEEVQNQNF